MRKRFQENYISVEFAKENITIYENENRCNIEDAFIELEGGKNNFEYIFYSGATILTFIVPILTMRTFAEERENRTEHTKLLTSPLSITKCYTWKIYSSNINSYNNRTLYIYVFWHFVLRRKEKLKKKIKKRKKTKKENKFLQIIKKKWLINGTTTLALVLIIILVFIALNMWMQSLELTPIDLSQENYIH